MVISEEKTEKNGSIIFYQVDHLSGEELGHMLDRLYEWGAKNVNIVPSFTKKNRPGSLVVADIGKKCKMIGRKLASCYGISGYHVMQTRHFCHKAGPEAKQLLLRYNGRSVSTDLLVKVVKEPGGRLYARPEYEDLLRLCNTIRQTFGLEVSLPGIRRYLQPGLMQDKTMEIELDKIKKDGRAKNKRKEKDGPNKTD